MPRTLKVEAKQSLVWWVQDCPLCEAEIALSDCKKCVCHIGFVYLDSRGEKRGVICGLAERLWKKEKKKPAPQT